VQRLPSKPICKGFIRRSSDVICEVDEERRNGEEDEPRQYDPIEASQDLDVDALAGTQQQ
jgi:hypothetical protein